MMGNASPDDPRGLNKAKKGLPFLKHISRADMVNTLGVSLLVLLLYAALFLCMGDPFLPYGGAWAVLLIWVCANVGGYLLDLVGLPPLLGMLVAGMVLRNIPGNEFLVGGLPKTWSKKIRITALAIIFLRSGLELDLKVFKRVGPVAARLTIIPGLVEAFVSGSVAKGVFGMPWLLAYSLGFILKAVGPAIVIQSMFDLQKAGWGVEKSIPAIVVGAASFDDMVAITGYSIFSNLAIPPKDGSPVMAILKGPLDIVLGLVSGVVCAAVCAPTRLWDGRLKRTAVVFLMTMAQMYLLDHFDYTSGGALGALILGLCVSIMWSKPWPRALALDHDGSHFGHEVEGLLSIVWKLVFMPLLFGIIGTLMVFSKLKGGVVPKAIGVLFSGLSLRIPTTFIITAAAGLTWKERLFIACAWTPKATVQAALAAGPLDMINENMVGEPDYEEYVAWGNEIVTTSVLAIIICAPLGVLLMRFAYPRTLTQAPGYGRVAAAPHGSRDASTHGKSDVGSLGIKDPKHPDAASPGPASSVALMLARMEGGGDKGGGEIEEAGEEERPTVLDAAFEEEALMHKGLSVYECLEGLEGEANTLEREGGARERAAAERLHAGIRELRKKLLDDYPFRYPHHNPDTVGMFFRVLNRASAEHRHSVEVQQEQQQQAQPQDAPQGEGGNEGNGGVVGQVVLGPAASTA